MDELYTFPYWPPTSPQRPAVIAGRQALRVIEDLVVNQSPEMRSDEIPLRPKPVPRVRPPELPVTPEAQSAGAVQPSLYSLFMLTETMPREQLAGMKSAGG